MRISEWSSDVCSSDLQRRAHATIIATAVSNPFLWRSRYNCTQKLGSVIGGGTGVGQSDTNTKLSRRIALISRPRSGGEIRPLRPVRMSSTWKPRTEEHTAELQPLMRISHADLSLKKNKEQK